MSTKKKVKFTVDIECYEETIISARAQYFLSVMGGDSLQDKTPIERLGMQVARAYSKVQEGKEHD